MKPQRRLFKALLYVALPLALALFSLDRYAAYAYLPTAGSTQVVLYTTAWCGYCAKLRQDLARSEIPYVERDVEKSLQGQLGFWALRARGVPVSVIGPTIVYGYRADKIAEAMQAIGYTYLPHDGTPTR